MCNGVPPTAASQLDLSACKLHRAASFLLLPLLLPLLLVLLLLSPGPVKSSTHRWAMACLSPFLIFFLLIAAHSS
jgi:phosphoglycerol transferase MdoB-like AlkP superfamily enzyme